MAQEELQVEGVITPMARASESFESQSSDESFSGSDDEDDEEPVLKYKRFAKEVVQSTCDGSEGARDVINCITVHPKVIFLECSLTEAEPDSHSSFLVHCLRNF